jgi:hypothetical protein
VEFRVFRDQLIFNAPGVLRRALLWQFFCHESQFELLIRGQFNRR